MSEKEPPTMDSEVSAMEQSKASEVASPKASQQTADREVEAGTVEHASDVAEDDADLSSNGAVGSDGSDVGSDIGELSPRNDRQELSLSSPTLSQEKKPTVSTASLHRASSISTMQPRGRIAGNELLRRPVSAMNLVNRKPSYPHPSVRSSRDSSPVRTEYGDDDNDDTMSVQSAAASQARLSNRPRPVSKSQKISSIQNIFSESQKIGYAGLCYLSVVHNKRPDIKGLKKSNEAYRKWAEHFMERLFIYLDISKEERHMIESLAQHGLLPSDLSRTLIDDAKQAAEVVRQRQEKRQKMEEEALEQGLPMDFDGMEDTQDGDLEPTDIRYTILTHLFILCISDGQYDARSRAVLKSVARDLEVPWLDVVKLEAAIAEQLRIYEDSEEVKGDAELMDKRNTADGRKRWLFTGLATLAGGAVIGLTAGLAAPLIAGGIGVALGTFGVTGATAALSTTGALALITTGGVLTGGSMGGFKMMKRTRGITQFEFLQIEDGLRQIEENKETRRTERRKKRRREARQALQEKMDTQRAEKTAADTTTDGVKQSTAEAGDTRSADEKTLAEPEEPIPSSYAPVTAEKLDRIGNWVSVSDSQRENIQSSGSGDISLKRRPPPVPQRPSAAVLAQVTADRSNENSNTQLKEVPSKPNNDQSESRTSPDLRRRSSLAPSNNENSSSSPLSGAEDDIYLSHDWGLDEGLGMSETDEEHRALESPTKFGDSTILWDFGQHHSESSTDGNKVKKDFTAADLDEVGTIDEDTAAAMFDDLQSTVDGDYDEGIRFKEPEGPPKAKQTNVLITVAGWITYGADDHTLPFSTLERDCHGDQYALCWETDALQELGSALKLLVGEVASFLVQQGLQATVLSTLMIGLTGPLWVMKLSYLVDNPWGIGLSKANKAGRVLADTLILGVQENRPVTLVGYSLGARVIFHCLLELASRGAYGIVEEVYLLGCPVMAEKKEWEQIVSVVSGRVVNGYSANDMVLGVLYRASVAVWNNVAGLRPVENVAGVENVNLDDVIEGHLDYRLCLPKVLEKLGFSITRDYFDDEDEEEERERLELEEEQRKEKEERLRVKEERLKKKQEEYEENLRKKKEEQERKRIEKEERERVKAEERRKKEEAAALAGPQGLERTTSRLSWFARRPSEKPIEKPKEIQDMMEEYWMPREIKSTLPTLVIGGEGPGEEDEIVPKSVDSDKNLPPLIIRTEEYESAILRSPGSLLSNRSSVSGRSGASSTDNLTCSSADELAQAERGVLQAVLEVEKAKAEVALATAAAAASAHLFAAPAHFGRRRSIASTIGSTGSNTHNSEDLEKMILAAQQESEGGVGVGAGDLVDRLGHVDDAEIEERLDSLSPENFVRAASPVTSPIMAMNEQEALDGNVQLPMSPEAETFIATPLTAIPAEPSLPSPIPSITATPESPVTTSPTVSSPTLTPTELPRISIPLPLSPLETTSSLYPSPASPGAASFHSVSSGASSGFVDAQEQPSDEL